MGTKKEKISENGHPPVSQVGDPSWGLRVHSELESAAIAARAGGSDGKLASLAAELVHKECLHEIPSHSPQARLALGALGQHCPYCKESGTLQIAIMSGSDSCLLIKI